MTLRLALYAEGVAELGSGRRPPSGQILGDEQLGSAHVLVRRAVARARAIDVAAITFQSPLTVRGREPRGSDLHDPAVLRRLLAFVTPMPGLCVVLVDADGKLSERRAQMSRVESPTVRVIAIAVQEFEGWLVADTAAAARVLGKTLDTAPEPDGMKQGVAKALWDRWTSALDSSERTAKRRDVAAHLDLDVLARRSASFAHLLSDLRVPA